MSVDYKIKESLKSTKILILEDDRVMVTLLRDVLTVMGFGEIIITADGREALAEMEKHAFDLIFTDWRLQGMDGIEFTNRVRNMRDNEKAFTPIIMLTGYARAEDVQVARDAGVTEYMIKPFSIKSLCDRIKSIIEHPRQFVMSQHYAGPDRRRKDEPEKIPNGIDRRKKKV